MKVIVIGLLSALLISCSNKGNTKLDNNESKEKKATSNSNDQIIDHKCVVLYVPDSLEEVKLQNEKSEEELAEIEYDKTMAISFLDSMKIKYYVENKGIYLFKLATGKIDTIDKKLYQNWGVILFSPDKSPKVVFINELETEFKSYFE